MKALELKNIAGENRIDSRLLEKRLGITHDAFNKTITKYFDKLQILGILRFEIEVIKGCGQPEKFVYLNEDQAIFALTLSRNTKQAVNLKLDLTIAFKNARKQTQSTLPPFRRRALLNRPQLKDGYFSAFFLLPSFV